MARRQHLAFTIFLAVVIFFSISYLFSSAGSSSSSSNGAKLTTGPLHSGEHMPADELAIPIKPAPEGSRSAFSIDLDMMPASILEGDSIAPKLENATLKAELGRATWKFLHTMAARFPESPTKDDRAALETFIHLFGRLYPCGDCARHFRELLAEFPPQTSSRNAAAGWLCFAHNQVNERLEKPIFDCNDIGDFYDCGCGEEGKKDEESEGEDEELGEPSLELE